MIITIQLVKVKWKIYVVLKINSVIIIGIQRRTKQVKICPFCVKLYVERENFNQKRNISAAEA